MVDGVLIAYFNQIPKQLEELLTKQNIPSVWLNKDSRYNCVSSDDANAVKLVVAHLHDLGHQHIAIVDYTGSSLQTNNLMRTRYDAFVEKCRDLGIQQSVWRQEGYVSRAERINLCRAELSKENRATAVIAVSYSNALPVQIAAQTTGLELPKDLSLITFTDDRTNLGGIDISSILVPLKSMGDRAADMLLRQIATPQKQSRSEKLDFIVNYEGTVGPCPINCPQR